MGGLKMVKGKVVKSDKAAVKPVKKAVAVKSKARVESDDMPIVSKSKVLKGATSVSDKKAVKSVKPEAVAAAAVKAEKTPRKITRNSEMVQLLLTREHTDEEIYAILETKYGVCRKNIPQCRYNLNEQAQEKGTEPFVRLMRGSDGTIAEYVRSAKSSGQKVKKEETKAKISLAISKLPKK